LDGNMDWIDLAQDRDKWQALVNSVMNFWVPQNEENFLIRWGLCCMELVSWSTIAVSSTSQTIKACSVSWNSSTTRL
jgi:hypothetical protein